MTTIDVDVAVAGAGTAGLAAYRAAVRRGKRAVLIESGVYGTTCARVGCMPSKLLIAAAEAAHHARHAKPFGITCSVEVDGEAVMDRVRRERDRFVGFVTDGVGRIPDCDKLRGLARFTGPRSLEVDRTRVQFRAAVVATGTSPFVPPMFEPIADRVVVNDHVFEWRRLPASVAVFGTGVIGVELGQALHRLGVRVRMYGHRGAIGGLTDPLVRKAALDAIGAELPIDTSALVTSVRRNGDGIEVLSGTGAEERFDAFEWALVAAGRRPNLASLALDRAEVLTDARGVPLFDRATLRCSSTNIFIAGDVNQDAALLHEAADEGTIAGDNAARFPDVAPGKRRSHLAITFCDPNIAVVGASHASLTGQREFVTGRIDFGDQGRSRIVLQNRGLGHVYADPKSGRFLGAELVGPRVEHIGHLLAWAHQNKMSIEAMLAMPFYHPVIEEGLRTALRDARAQLSNTT